MKRALLIILLLTVVGFAASLYLIPRTGEIALINFKDKKFDEARVAYEQQLQNGIVSPEVVNTLVDLYLQVGAIDKAIDVMERYIATRPNDIEARRRLGELYQFAQRPDDYLRNLEEINRIQPSAETLQALSQIYNFNSQYDKQAEALKKLIAVENQANPQHYIDLANLQASKQARVDAIDTLQKFRAALPQSFTFAQEELLVSLLLDEKRVDEAYAASLSWRQANPPAAESARLINLLHFKGNAEAAGRLMDTYDTAAIDAEPALLEEKILLMLALGQEKEAYDRLKGLYAQDKLSNELKNRLLFLAINRGDDGLTKDLLAHIDMAALNESQLMALLELSLTRGDTGLKQKIAERVATPETQAQYPLLSGSLAVVNRMADANDRLAQLAHTELASQQNLQVARICARMQRYDCTNQFLARLPEPKNLSDGDVAGVADLYLETKAYAKGEEFLKAASEGRQSAAIEQVKVKYAAVRGDADTVRAWLAANAQTATARTLTDLFFIARQNKQHALSAVIAEQLYAKAPGTQTRSYLTAAYLAMGNYPKAVALLRDAKPFTPEDENNYLMALTKLARTSPEYRRELGAYAGAQLRADIPQKRKMALIYALINAGQLDVAMPYIRVLAMNHGGEWASLYAGQLDKEGKYDEARSFWIQLANQPTTSRVERKQIAYNLLARGYTDDALPIFNQLANTAPARSDEVHQLLYLLGPRLNANQLDWLADRFNAAQDDERAQWAEYIAAYASPDEIIPLAEQRHPEILFAPPVMHAYVAALATTGQLRDKHQALLKGIAENGDPALLRVYADTARQNGYQKQALEAYQALFAVAPNDNAALRESGLLAYALADYNGSRQYLGEYMQSNGAATEPAADTYNAIFYYAELLRRDRRSQEAAPYYQQAIQLIDANGLSDADAQSKKAQALIWLAQPEDGFAVYQNATAQYPQDDNLRADWIAALVEAGRYEDARQLIADPLARVNAPQDAGAPLPIPQGMLISQQTYGKGGEVLLRLQGSDMDLRQFTSNAQSLPWISYTSEGYGQLLVAAQPGVTLSVQTLADGQTALVPQTAADETHRALRLRYELLAARIDVETGHVYAATQRLNGLMPEYPDDAQLMGFTANVENYGGNWHRAQALLAVAKTLAPENEDIALLDRDIRRTYSPNVKLDQEWVKRGDNRENITTLSGNVNATDKLVVGVVAQNNNVRIGKTVEDFDPLTGAVTKSLAKFRKNRVRGEVYAQYHRDNGDRFKVSLFGNNDTPGIGLYYDFLNPLGESGIVAEFRRPYWEAYTEAVYFDTTRDRVSLWHTIKPDTRWTLRAEPGLNSYRIGDAFTKGTGISGFDTHVDSWSFDGSIVYRPIDNMPYLYLAYGLSAEYFTSNHVEYDVFNTFHFRDDAPVPFRTHEIHSLSVTTGYDFDDQTYASGMLGYAYDRHGGNGPLVEGRVTHEFTDKIDAQLRAAYGISTESDDGNETRVGGYLRYRF
jgi:hypothetical protein